jgi:thymidylate kinase
MLIECLGVAGCGKTSFVSCLHDALVEAGEPPLVVSTVRLQASGNKRLWAVGLLEKCYRCSVAAWSNPGAAVGLLVCVIAGGQRSLKDLAKALINMFELRWLIRRNKRRARCVLLDQGIYQSLWSAAWSATAAEPNRLCHLLRRMLPAPNVVVSLAVSRELLAERLDRRGESHSRLEKERGKDPEAIDRAERLRLAIELELARQARPVIVRVNNNGDAPALRCQAQRFAGKISAIERRR